MNPVTGDQSPPTRDDGGQSVSLPLVTIMIPTYNQAGVILDAVDSALAQDYPNLEVVVADDASSDDTARILARRRDPKLRYHRNQKNLGRVGNYRNTLYRVANGDWAVNLDGDDYFSDPGFIRAAIDLGLMDRKILVVMADARGLDEGRKIHRRRGREPSVVSGLQAIEEIVDGRRRFFHLATMYRRAAALELGFYDFDCLSTDFLSIARLAMRGRVGFLDREVGEWRPSESSASMSGDWEQLIRAAAIWPRIFGEAVTHGMDVRRARTLQDRMLALDAYRDLSRLASLGRCQSCIDYIVRFYTNYGLRSFPTLASRWRLYHRLLYGCVASAVLRSREAKFRVERTASPSE